jgi:diacylglycerol kinase (ATP)
MGNQTAKGLRRLINAFGYSMAGFRSCFEHEEAFRLEVYIVVPLVPVALWWGQTPVERALLLGSLLLVPIVELLNSALETTVDRIGAERHELAGRAKDISSSAVLLAIVLAVAVWGILLLPRLL